MGAQHKRLVCVQEQCWRDKLSSIYKDIDGMLDNLLFVLARSTWTFNCIVLGTNID